MLYIHLEKTCGFGIRKKTVGYSTSILRGFRNAGLSFWWEAGKNGDNGWNTASGEVAVGEVRSDSW